METNKRINLVIFILIMFIFLIPVSYGFSFKDWFKPFAFQTGCQENKEGNNLLIPFGGRIECEDIDLHATTIKDFNEKGMFVICGDEENTDKCGQLDISCSENDLIIAVRFDPMYRPEFRDDCPIGGEKLCKLDIPHRTGIKNSFNPTEITSMKNGERIQVYCAGHIFGIGTGKYYPGKVRENYVAYGLNIIEKGMKRTISTTSCRLTELPSSQVDNICVSTSSEKNYEGKDVCEGATESKTGLGNTIINSVVPYNDWINFVSHWVYAPADMNLAYYLGQEVYCSLNRIYSVGTVELRYGCYKYPSSFIRQVECCPGQIGTNIYCGDDFKWHSGDGPCISDLQCYGQGDEKCDINTLTLKYGRCVNKFCQTVTTKSVECCPPAYGCYGGVCSIAQGYKCTQERLCDYDGICEPLMGETWYNCGDCIEPQRECNNCFEWLRNVVQEGYCKEKGQDKIWGFIPVSLSSQETLCPIYITILFSILAITGTIIYVKLRRKKR